MTALVGSIAARLVADAAPLSRGLDLAGSKVVTFERSVAQRFARLDRTVTRSMGTMGSRASLAFATFGRNVLVGVGSLITARAVIGKTQAALEDFGAVADASKAAGLDPELYQSITYQAKLGGVEIEGMAAALASFNRNAGLAEVGTGRMVTALKKLDPELLAALQAADTQAERVRLAADAIAKAEGSAKKAALAVALFGNEGTKLVDIFASGAAGIDAMYENAKRLGLVVERDLIERADTLGDEFETVTSIVDLKLKKALVDLGPTLIWLANQAGWVAEEFGRMTQELKPIEERTHLGTLQSHLKLLQNEMDPLRRMIEAGQGDVKIGNVWDQMFGDTTAAEKYEALMTQALEYQDRIARLQGMGTPPPPLTPPPSTDDVDLFDDIGADDRNAAAEAALREAEAVRKLIDDLLFERSLVGKSEAEQRALTAARQAGAAATSEQRAQIIGLVTSIEGEQAAIEAVKQRIEEAQATASDFIHGFVDDLRNGVSAAEALSNAFAKLGDRLIDLALDQAIGTLFQNLGGLFGLGGSTGSSLPIGGTSGYIPGLTGPSLWASGGYTGIGGKYEPAGIVHKGEYVFDADAVRRIGVPNLERIRGYANGGYVNGGSGIPHDILEGGSVVNVYNENRSTSAQVRTERSRGPKGETIIRNVILDAKRRGAPGF